MKARKARKRVRYVRCEGAKARKARRHVRHVILQSPKISKDCHSKTCRFFEARATSKIHYEETFSFVKTSINSLLPQNNLLQKATIDFLFTLSSFLILIEWNYETLIDCVNISERLEAAKTLF